MSPFGLIRTFNKNANLPNFNKIAARITVVGNNKIGAARKPFSSGASTSVEYGKSIRQFIKRCALGITWSVMMCVDQRDGIRIKSSSITLFTHFKTNTKSVDIYRMLRCCCELMKNQNILKIMKWGRPTRDLRFL